jgi:hypothetical protein
MNIAIEIFVGTLEGNGAPGRPNRTFQDDIEMKLRELGRDKVEQFFCITHTVQILIVNT